MMSHTFEIIKTALKADNSVSASDRARVLATIRNGGSKSPETARLAEPRVLATLRHRGSQAPEPAKLAEPRLIRRAEAAHRLGCSLRLVDRLAKDGALIKRKLPGRKRAAGILESDLLALIAQETACESCA
jgi:hypothetical protein